MVKHFFSTASETVIDKITAQNIEIFYEDRKEKTINTPWRV